MVEAVKLPSKDWLVEHQKSYLFQQHFSDNVKRLSIGTFHKPQWCLENMSSKKKVFV